jgi:hypothetical protein
MCALPNPDALTEEQRETLERAALLVIKARGEAAALLQQSGLEPIPEQGWFGSPCGASLPPPPAHHPCLCRDYKGDGGPCRSTFLDFSGPDLGSGPPRVTCGHRPSQHLAT